MGDVNTEYLEACAAFAETVRADAEILTTAGELLSLPSPQLGMFPSLPRGARHINTGNSHSVAYLGRTQDARHVVLSVATRNPYLIGLGRGERLLEERISGFDYLSRRGKTTPLCVVSVPMGSDSLRLAGLVLEDITHGGEFKLDEIGGEEYATVLDPRGNYDVFIDPEGFNTDVEVGKAYLDSLHIKL